MCYSNFGFGGLGFRGCGYMPFYTTPYRPFIGFTNPYYCRRPMYYPMFGNYSAVFAGAMVGASLGTLFGGLINKNLA